MEYWQTKILGMWNVGMWNVVYDMLVCGMRNVECDIWYVGMWYVVCWCWHVDMVIGIEIVDVFVNFFGKSKKWIEKPAIRKKYDHIETLKLWPYNI
jgi:hypothetical protein